MLNILSSNLRLPLIIILLSLLFSCGGPMVTPPTFKVIPPDTIVEVIVKYHLTEGLSTMSSVNGQYRNFKEVNITDSMLSNLGYNRSMFDSSISYYSSDPRNFDEIYNKVLVKLNTLEAQLQQQILIKQKIADSIAIRTDSIKRATALKLQQHTDSFKRKIADSIRKKIVIKVKKIEY